MKRAIRKNAVTSAARKAKGDRPLSRIGTTGLRQYSGHVREEFLVQLSGNRAAKIFRQMRDNDDIVGAIMYAIETILRSVPWVIEPKDPESVEDVDAAAFIDECRMDVHPSWEDFISDVLSFLTYGWSLHEILYKRREDGRLGWHSFPTRSQDTLYRWEWDKKLDQAVGLWQIPRTSSPIILIPFSKAMLFRTTGNRNNPEGRSLLRNAYRPWYHKRNIEEVEAIGVERDLAGLPVMYVPQEWTNPNASDANKALFADAQDIVRNIRRDEQEGIILPSIYDRETKEALVKLELLTAGSRRQFDTDKIVMRYSRGIAGTLLADFILLGHTKAGSWALSSDKTDMFEYALQYIADIIASVISIQAIPDLLRMNAMPGKCKVAPGKIDKPDMSKLGDFLAKVVTTGVIIPDDQLEAHVRTVSGLPQRDESTERLPEEPDKEVTGTNAR